MRVELINSEKLRDLGYAGDLECLFKYIES